MTKKTVEQRAINNSNFKIEKRSEDDNFNTLSGYAIVFDQPSENLGGFIEYVDNSALDNVDMSNVQLLYNHNMDNILARADSSTLSLSIDDKGLFFNAQIPNTTLGNDVAENVRNGNLKGCSFGFTIDDDDWSDLDEDTATRHITQIGDLFELSITPMPAYKETSVSNRSLSEFESKKNKKEDSNLNNELELLRMETELYDKRRTSKTN
ncbi:MAG TPA: HK97 family phage prohead protease [Candidatus Companilactobacillus pullicola]|uniref:HK97 family phage prohead protease n=1 Tax=Candidatus Companilactobacillus pullicola TaxID=2838523 RepID=A0A9D1ZLF0_9LACO|nr:HK97 family phage prohead protease [Candidatus Companilactobacillus pullicola]